MSFRCQNEKCRKVGQNPHRVVTKTRTAEHVELRGGEYGKKVPMIVGVGEQIVEEKNLCDNCIEA